MREAGPKGIAAASTKQCTAAILIAAALQSKLGAYSWFQHGDWFTTAATNTVPGIYEAGGLTIVHGLLAKSIDGR